MRALKIATVPYVNIDPFVRALETLAPCAIERHRPSDLPRIWAGSDVDLCMLSAPAIRDLQLQPLGGASISATGPVLSVLVCSPSPMSRWRRVALDGSSITSNELARWLLEEVLGLSLTWTRADRPDRALLRGEVDAAVIIGDAALRSSWPHVLDLSGLWHDATGLPFVFATWVRGRRTSIPAALLEELLSAAVRRSAGWIASCARGAESSAGLPRDLVERYLRRHISYDFGADERLGLKRFLHGARERNVPALRAGGAA